MQVVALRMSRLCATITCMATTQISIRIDEDLLRRMGEAAEAYSAKVGVKVSRNAFMELAMAKGLDALSE